MFKRLCFICTALSLLQTVQGENPIENLRKWLESPKGNLKDQKFSQIPLNRNEAALADSLLFKHKMDLIKTQETASWKNKSFVSGNLRMPFLMKIFGSKPANGRSLYISMHGGGSAPKEVNDAQWKNQIELYRPKEGLYIAPRAPWDEWNMWFKSELDDFFDRLIRSAVATYDVNPDKVYLLGYSAGGDGVWRLAPRMADRWAAASMMAGHPGDVSLVNLRNVPFMIWMGELDDAYDRNKRAKEQGGILDSLKKNDPEGYIHETHIVQNKKHWMERVDTAAISWMSHFERNALATKIVWRQEEVVKPSLYWLSVPMKEATKGKKIIAEREQNTIILRLCDYKKLTILLNDEMLDLDKPVKIIYKDRIIYNKKISRNIGSIARSIDERADKRAIFCSEINLTL